MVERVDLAEHVPGTPYRYRHGWVPLVKTDFRKMVQGSKSRESALSPSYNEVPEIRGTSRTKGALRKTSRDAEDAAKLASFKHAEIRKQDLTAGAANSRAVSPAEFQKISALGAAEYQKYKRDTAPISALDDQWSGTVNAAYAETRKPWGGATIDAHTGEFLKGNEDKYALSVRDPGMETISISDTAGPVEFRKAMTAAKLRYGHILERKDHHLGVFHDSNDHTINFDPVLVTNDKHHTETIGAYTHAVGGAYHFKSGNGYWPPHVSDDLAEKERLTHAKMTGKATPVDRAVLAFESHITTGKYNPDLQPDTAAPTIGETIKSVEAEFGFNRRRWPKRLLRAAAPFDPLAQLALGGSGAKRTYSKVKTKVPRKVRSHRPHNTKIGYNWTPDLGKDDTKVPDYGDVFAEMVQTGKLKELPGHILPQGRL